MKKGMTIKANNIMFLLVVLFFVAIIAKLSYVVLSDKVDGINLKEKSASITTVTKDLYANRGSIYDVNGSELATSVNSYNVIAYLSKSRTTDINNPKHVVDVAKTAKALALLLNMTEARLIELLSKDKYQVELGPGGRGITESLKAEIEKLELPGIEFLKQAKKRYYSKSSFASYIVGYAKENDEGKLVGEMGIEKYFDDELSGTNGYTKYLKYTSSNYQIPNTPEETVDAKNGNDIYLTIDSKIQLIVENAVSKMKKDFDTDWALFAVVDANTGAIVASATNPSYNPNDLNTIKEYLNPLVSYTYEPGSVMKIFSFASTMEEGKYNGSATYKSGAIQVDSKTTIRDAERKGWGTISFDTGFAYSSNVAATILTQKLGADVLRGYYERLGFDKKTGIELSNELTGTIDFKYASELATASFGQGITVTPIEMLSALLTMTNDGVTLKPYVVDKIVDSDGNTVYQGKREEVNKVYSKETVEKMHNLMHNVVYKGLTKMWQPNNVSVMGKTGTAQIATKGGYLDDDYIRSFAGIFPEDNPKYIAYTVVRGMKGQKSAWAKTITTAIEEIASYAKLTDLQNDVNLNKVFTIDNYISLKTSDVIQKVKGLEYKVNIIGDGNYVINQYPLKGNTILDDGKLFILTNASTIMMPNMSGWSMNEVKVYCDLVGLKYNINGYGYVISQSILPNQIIDLENNMLEVELKT